MVICTTLVLRRWSLVAKGNCHYYVPRVSCTYCERHRFFRPTWNLEFQSWSLTLRGQRLLNFIFNHNLGDLVWIKFRINHPLLMTHFLGMWLMHMFHFLKCEQQGRFLPSATSMCQEFCPQGVYTRLGRHLRADSPPRDGHCSKRYASYWTAFLFFISIFQEKSGIKAVNLVAINQDKTVS